MIKKSITVTEQQDKWIQKEVRKGHYATDSELVREALREKQMRMAEIEAIRARLVAAEESGYSDRTPAQIRKDARARLKKDSRL